MTFVVRRAALIAAMFVVGCAPGPELPDIPARERLAFDDALPVVRDHVGSAYRAVENDPRDADANGQLGMVLSTYRQTAAALTMYRRARALAPNAFRWVYYEAFSLFDLGQSLDAIDAFERALELDPGHPGARAKLAALKLDTGDVDKSKRLFAGLVADHPDRADAHLGLGRALASLGENDTAIDALKEALRLAPGTGDVHYALAETYRRNGNATEAERHYLLSERYKGSRLRAPDELLLAVGNLNRSDAPHIAKGRYFSATGRYGAAVTEFEAAIAVNATNASAHSERVAAYMAGGDHKSAAIAYLEGLEHADTSAPLHLHGGRALAASGDLPAAATALSRALDLDSNRADIAWTLATVKERQGDREAVLKFLKAAHELEPDNRDYRYRYGSKLLEAGDHDAAIRTLESLAKDQAADSPAHLQVLAMAYQARGDVDQCIELLDAALEVSRKTGDVRRAGEIAGQLERLNANR